MAGHYHHTQLGTLKFTVLWLATRWALLGPPEYSLWPLFVGWARGSAWPLSSLTVEVSDAEIRWYFGQGVWECGVALSDIKTVRIVRNHWLDGFLIGIEIRPGFRRYNVSGFDGVELWLKAGAYRRIGTDDPQGLTAALTGQGVLENPFTLTAHRISKACR
jgi:hypothetical protein